MRALIEELVVVRLGCAKSGPSAAVSSDAQMDPAFLSGLAKLAEAHTKKKTADDLPPCLARLANAAAAEKEAAVQAEKDAAIQAGNQPVVQTPGGGDAAATASGGSGVIRVGSVVVLRAAKEPQKANFNGFEGEVLDASLANHFKVKMLSGPKEKTTVKYPRHQCILKSASEGQEAATAAPMKRKAAEPGVGEPHTKVPAAEEGLAARSRQLFGDLGDMA